MKKIILQNLKVALFFFAVQFIVALIFSHRIFSAETVISLAILSAITSLFLIICMVLYQFFLIKKNKIALDDFGIQAKQEATFTVDKSIGETKKTIENVIPEKINSYKFKYNEKLDYYKTKTGASIRSWGEIVIVRLTKLTDSQTQLDILSKPIYKTTFIDFGKSSMNIEKIKSAFN